MTTENWKLQVSMKATNGDLINVRANTADELSVLLEGIADYSHQVAATSKAIAAAYTVLPLATGGSTQDTAPAHACRRAPTTHRPSPLARSASRWLGLAKARSRSRWHSAQTTAANVGRGNAGPGCATNWASRPCPATRANPMDPRRAPFATAWAKASG